MSRIIPKGTQVFKTLAAFLVVASFTFGCSAVAQDSSKKTQQIPTEGATAAAEPYVIELLQTKLRYEADGKGTRELLLRVRINSEVAVRDFGLLVYPFAASFETLDVVYARVRKADGSVVETPASDVQEIDSAVSRQAPMYTDEREKHIAIKALGVGDVLEVSLRWTIHDAVAPGHFWHDHNFFKEGKCQKEIVELDIPKELKISVRSAGNAPTIREEGARRIYTYETSHPMKEETSKIPAWEANYHGMAPPDLQISSFTTWEEVGRWFAGLAGPKIEVGPEIKAKAEELVRGKPTDEEKTAAIYDFVSKKFRYIGISLGIGRYAPHAATDVLTNRYGDCKDKHVLFAALLKASGIEASAALISSVYRIDAQFPSPSLFDHVITEIPRGSELVFYDTTPEVTPFGFLLPGLRDRQTLVARQDGKSQLHKTPLASPIPNYEKFDVEGNIDEKGTLDAKIRIEDRGDNEVGLRMAFRNTARNRWDELGQAFLARLGFGGTVSEVTGGDPEDTARPFWVALHYHRVDFSEWKTQRITLPTPPVFLLELNEEQLKLKDNLPLGAPIEITYTSKITLPPGYSAVLPPNTEEKKEFLDFSMRYTLEKNTVGGVIRLRTLQVEVPGTERAEFNKSLKVLVEAQGNYIFIHGPGQTSAFAPQSREAVIKRAIANLETAYQENPENEEIAQKLSELYNREGRASDTIAMLEHRAAGEKGLSPALWMELGIAYLRKPDTDKAVKAFTKAADGDSSSDLLNNAAAALSEANTHLELAMRFAERAVKQIEDETEVIQPGNISGRELAMMPKLAAVWDTIGWLKFQANDIAGATKYLVAAWNLMQVPAIGEHLVEVYEKTGHKQKAAEICNMARSSFAPGSENGTMEKLELEMKRLRPFLPTKLDGNMALSEIRTISVAIHPKLKEKFATARFTFVQSNNPGLEVKFRSGSTDLEDTGELQKNLKLPQTFPDDGPTRIVRTGTFSCSVYAKTCTLVLTNVVDAAIEAGMQTVPSPIPPPS